MNIFVTGGTGFVGSALIKELLKQGHSVTSISRHVPMENSETKLKFIAADGTIAGPWQEEIAKHDAVINLAGVPVFGKWNDEYKRNLKNSRILTTRNVVEGIASNTQTVLISASGTGYYGFTKDETITENHPPGTDFLALLASEWEAEALKAEAKGARVVITRFGMVLGANGGALQQMILPFKMFAGGPLGSGKQFMPWIHIDDLIAGLIFCMNNDSLSGAFNFTAPTPVTNKQFSRVLGSVLRRPSFMPAPGFVIRSLLGEFGSVILEGQNAVPQRLEQSGFKFQHFDLEAALRDILT